jgi:DNA-binding NtrC family response regulator
MRAVPPSTDLRTMERQMIERILHETEWNKTKAAHRLGLSRTKLYGRLRRYGLETPPANIALA